MMSDEFQKKQTDTDGHRRQMGRMRQINRMDGVDTMISHFKAASALTKVSADRQVLVTATILIC